MKLSATPTPARAMAQAARLLATTDDFPSVDSFLRGLGLQVQYLPDSRQFVVVAPFGYFDGDPSRYEFPVRIAH